MKRTDIHIITRGRKSGRYNLLKIVVGFVTGGVKTSFKRAMQTQGCESDHQSTTQ